MKYLFFLFISFSYLWSDAHIFVYHRFGDDRYPSTNTTIEQLRHQFDYLKNNGYTVVPIKKIVDKVTQKKPITEKWVGLAIDDAYKSFYTNALPIFKEYNYPFTLYVYVEATNKRYPDFMTWEELKEASNYGSIGLHSYSHKRMTTLTQKEIYEDTKKSYDIFKFSLGYNPSTYVHPYGEYNNKVLKELSKFNFDAIFNQNSGSIDHTSPLNDLNRIPITGDANIKYLLRYKTFNTTWISPKEFPKDGLLKHIKAKVDPKYKKLKLYITGFGWRDIKVNNGVVNETVNIKLKKSRTRIILGPSYYNISNNIIIK